ncbi:aKG-HExxH-type peptide beta-hydroxylase [Pontimicrobium sp. MEBiC06410]
MAVKTQTHLKDWEIMAVPQPDASDTMLILKHAKNSNLIPTPPHKENEPKLFNNKVTLRHFTWDENFLSRFKHAPFNHPSIKEAENIIKLWPEVYTQFGDIITAFNPVLIQGVEDQKDYGGSNSHQPNNTLGSVWATVHNPVLLAQALVHEMAHNKLFALGQHFTSKSPLFKNEDHELFDSPIRLDIPRPISAVFHGVYAFTHVLALDNILFKKGNTDYKNQVLNVLEHNALRVKKGLFLIEKCAKLTEQGHAFLTTFSKWANQEITEALNTLKTNITNKDKPIIIIGPNSDKKTDLVKALEKQYQKPSITSKELYLAVLSQSSIIKQKKIAIYGSLELVEVLEKSEKFSDVELLQNWLTSGVFNIQELEFMQLQLANYILKNHSGTILNFDEAHTFFKQPKFLDRLHQLFREFNAKVIYVRPVLAIKEAVDYLSSNASDNDTKRLHDLLHNPSYRTLSNYTFDSESTIESIEKQFI